MRGTAQDAERIAARRRTIIETGFSLFAQHGIENVSMPEIAQASGVGRATIFRYFQSKLELVVEIGAVKWRECLQENQKRIPEGELARMNAAEYLGFYLDSFLYLYRNHRDILRFNQYFNIYVQTEHATPEQMKPYNEIVYELLRGCHEIYRKATEDGTVRTDVTEEALISATLHIMLATVTRYAVGLVFVPKNGSNPEEELIMLRDLLQKQYTVALPGGDKR